MRRDEKADHNTLGLGRSDGQTQAEVLADAALLPAFGAAATTKAFCTQFGELGITELAGSLATQTKKMKDGDLGRAEAMLLSQAHTLDAIFNALAQRAAMNAGQYMDAADKYLRLALKAQNQCRATLQTLGEMKNPQPVAFVKQANITSGPQQVNNGATCAANPHAHAAKNEFQQNELLEQKFDEQLDTRAPGAAVSNDSTMATMGAIDRANNRAG